MNPSPKRLFIFLAGVHGAGKSSVCQSVFEPAGFHCVSASSIIRNAAGEVRPTKTVVNVDSNQAKLLDGVSELKLSHRWLILDGHFVLLRPDKEFERIDVAVYRELNPDAIIVMKAAPELIASRLGSRDATSWNPNFVERFQDCEIEHASRIAAELKIPIQILECTDDAKQLISKLIEPPSK